ncbi:MAG: STAS domain-containing protein [Bacteroidales bacterium]|nr:STAS domain-containing protein [Bacteroidales bacterium]
MDYCVITKKSTYTLIEILADRLDIRIAASLKSDLVQLNGNREKNIVLDLSNCAYCDSSGLSAILVANRLCKNSKGIFVLCGLQEAIERLITISQLDSVLTIVSTKEKADDLLNND